MLKIISVAATVVLIAMLYSGLEGQSQEPPRQDSQSAQQPTDTQQRGTEQSPFVIKILPPTKSEEKPSNEAHDGKSETEGQLVKATWALVALAALQFGALCAQAFYLARTITHNRRIERAHVFGGTNHVTLADGRKLLVVTINNYGKTPASIGTVAATICAEGELDTFPGWEINGWQGHPFIKKWKGYVFGEVSGQLIDVAFPFEGRKVIAGRIWYRDIFKKQYSVGFLLKTDDLTAVGGRKTFWEQREEKDPNE